MRWVDMEGPITPIILQMAGWYAKRSKCEFDDLVQEAWWYIYYRNTAVNLPLIAQTAMQNYITKQRTLRKYDQFRAIHGTYSSPSPYLPDVPLYLSRLNKSCLRVIFLKFWKDYPRKQIAQTLDIRESTVHRRFKRAIKDMRHG